MRHANGYGCVRKLHGNRRKPYMVEKTIGYELVNGKAKRKYQIIGYYRTQAEANISLAEYNKNPYSTEKLTFEEVFERWSKVKFEKLSLSAKRNYDRAYRYLSPLHKKDFRSLRTLELESVINDSEVAGSNKVVMKRLLNEMYKYALKYEIVSTDYSARFTVEKPETKIVREVFTKEEISSLWANQGDTIVDMTLILLYSGMRVGELLTCEIENGFFRGGEKTEAGKNRLIPIHSKIVPLLPSIEKMTLNTFYPRFKQTMARLGMNHNTHDCRVTFISRADGVMNDTCLKLIVGHKITDITKGTYTKKSLEQLKEEMEKICYE